MSGIGAQTQYKSPLLVGNPFEEIRAGQAPGTDLAHSYVTGKPNRGNQFQNFFDIHTAPESALLLGDTSARGTLLTGGLSTLTKALGAGNAGNPLTKAGNFVGGLFGRGPQEPAQWEKDIAGGRARENMNKSDPRYNDFVGSPDYNDISGSRSADSEAFTQAFMLWKAKKDQSEANYNDYVQRSREQPGRDATILTGPSVRRSVLG